MKKLLFLLTLCFSVVLGSCEQVHAQNVKYDHFRIQKKSLAVGKSTSLAAPDNVWIQISDTGSSRAALLISGTDTGKITGTKQFGTMMLNRSDSSLRIWLGSWKKITITN
jgi:hypothetical protein